MLGPGGEGVLRVIVCDGTGAELSLSLPWYPVCGGVVRVELHDVLQGGVSDFGHDAGKNAYSSLYLLRG